MCPAVKPQQDPVGLSEPLNARSLQVRDEPMHCFVVCWVTVGGHAGVGFMVQSEGGPGKGCDSHAGGSLSGARRSTFPSSFAHEGCLKLATSEACPK